MKMDSIAFSSDGTFSDYSLSGMALVITSYDFNEFLKLRLII